jgi:hypothetical protein
LEEGEGQLCGATVQRVADPIAFKNALLFIASFSGISITRIGHRGMRRGNSACWDFA